MWEEYPFVEDEVCCQKTALAFVDSIAEIWSPLLSGIPLAVIDDPALKDPARLVAMLAEHRVTRIVGVPSLLATLLESAPSDISERLSRLRFCVSSGEPLPEDLARLFHQHLPRTRLLNLYGSSEVAADVTATEIGPDAPICVGQPIANAHVVILDQYLQPVPRGAIGEVCAGGGVLARGYLNAPGLTADRFIPDSFGHLPGARLYRTGDLGRWSVEGHLEVVGRRDHQVKIRGYRIETSEIEAALREHPSVSDAVVVAAGTGTARRLAAYVVARSRFAPTDLRTFLRARLPEYMLPAVYLELGAFPRTRTGKVDRRALPEPLESSHQTRAVFTSERQRQISAIWQDVLQTEQVGIDDNFFDVGGNSLLAVRLRSRLQSVLGTDLPLIELFRFPTIAAQAEYLGGASTPEVALARRMARQIDTQHRRRNLRQQHRREAISSDRWRVAEHS
jgi:acyl-coenzyme A synthetase/AMP-(fatty) acid ligase/acyl carrier protein